MSKAAYGGQQGELAQLEQLNGVKNYVDKYGRTKTTNATESHDAMASKGKTNTPMIIYRMVVIYSLQKAILKMNCQY